MTFGRCPLSCSLRLISTIKITLRHHQTLIQVHYPHSFMYLWLSWLCCIYMYFVICLDSVGPVDFYELKLHTTYTLGIYPLASLSSTWYHKQVRNEHVMYTMRSRFQVLTSNSGNSSGQDDINASGKSSVAKRIIIIIIKRARLMKKNKVK